jgi:putative copper export protein
MNKLTPIFYIVLASVLGLVALGAFIAMVRALTVRDTLSAVESALGTGVITILLVVMANKLFKAGWQRLRAPKQDPE